MSVEIASTSLVNRDAAIPDGWELMPLIRAAEIRLSGVDKKSRPGEKCVFLCNYTDVYNNDYIIGTEDFMQATASPAEISRCSLQVGDVVITKDSETPDDIGVPAVVIGAPRNLICGYHLALIRPRDGVVDPVFIAKQLNHSRLTRYFGQMANGTTRYGLSTAAIENTPIWRPSLPAQEKAALILRTVDNAIDHAQALIAKLKNIKTGLLHDLLTRGIDENGELRDPERNPDHFTEINGQHFPRDWTPSTLGAVGNWHAGGTPSKGVPKFWSGSIPWLTPKDMKVFRIEETTDYITTLGAESGTCLVPRDSVFIVVRGMILAHTFPVCICAKPMAFNQDVRAITSNGSAEMLFLGYWLTGNASSILRLTTESTHGTKRFDVNELRRYPIAVPQPPEQGEIVLRMSHHDERIAYEEHGLRKLRGLKDGLAHDLLTGNVPVPTLELVS